MMGMTTVLLPGAVLPVSPADYAISAPFVIVGQRISIDFTAVVTTPGPIDWFFEFTEENPATTVEWFRELAEENTGGGVTEMPLVVRTLRTEGLAYANLPAGTTRVAAQFERHHKIGRIRARMRSGAASLRAVVVFGDAAVPPA